MNELRYPARALFGDYLRAGLGLALTLPPTFAVPAGSIAQYVLGALALLFAAFGARTAARQASRVVLDPARITLSALRRTSLEWSALRAAKLNYYSTRSDRGEGWMQLTLKGSGGAAGGTIRVDSNLDGFVDVARAAAAAAQANRVPLTETSRVNFTSLGIAIAEPEAANAPGARP